MKRERSGHETHPGYTASDCSIRHTVNPAYGATVAPGYACLFTGGHCLPGKACASYRKQHREQMNERV